MKKLIIATRGSKLALWQSNHIKDTLERLVDGLSVELKVMKTKGDKIIDTPLAKIGGKGLFTKELEDAMLAGEAHLAVHSLKDVPVAFPEGLGLHAITKREDPRDAMLSEKYADIDALPKGAVVGTTSLRRRMQLLKYRPDLDIQHLRGNVDTRISKLKDGQYDAIILASAGLNRLGLNDDVKYVYAIDKKVMIPAMGQAAIGIECVEDDAVINIVRLLNNDSSLIETTVERAFVKVLEGGCQVPIGVNAQLDGDKLSVTCAIGMPDGSRMIEEKLEATKADVATLGDTLAELVIKKGARELLKEAEIVALNEIL